jgi:hypothetical protein
MLVVLQEASKTDTVTLTLGLASIAVLMFGVLRLCGYFFNKGMHFENRRIVKNLKEHWNIETQEWHTTLGQFRRDIDLITINTTYTRDLGFPAYMYTVLHEYYHSQYHRGVVKNKEADIQCEKEAHEWASKFLNPILHLMVELGFADAAQPNPLFRDVDGKKVVVVDGGKAVRKNDKNPTNGD